MDSAKITTRIPAVRRSPADARPTVGRRANRADRAAVRVSDTARNRPVARLRSLRGVRRSAGLGKKISIQDFTGRSGLSGVSGGRACHALDRRWDGECVAGAGGRITHGLAASHCFGRTASGNARLNDSFDFSHSGTPTQNVAILAVLNPVKMLAVFQT